MLGKLFRLEMKQSSKFSLAIIGLQLISVILASSAFSFISLDLFSSSSEDRDMAAIFLVMGLIIVIVASLLVMTFTPLIMQVYHAYRYYKLFTSNGYLMFTLPCTKSQLFLSKFFTCLLWTVMNFITFFISIGIFVATVIKHITGGISLKEAGYYFNQFITNIKRAMEESGTNFNAIVITYVLMMVISMLFSIASYYFAISIGQLFNKHKLVACIGAYFGIYTIFQMISTVLSVVMAIVIEANGNYEITYIPVNIIMSIFAISGLVGSYFIMKNKLNLE